MHGYIRVSRYSMLLSNTSKIRFQFKKILNEVRRVKSNVRIKDPYFINKF